METYQTLTRGPRGRRIAAAVALGLVLGATSACSDAVRVLNAPIEANASSVNFAHTVLTVGPYRTDAIVLVTASGEARRVGPPAQAGVMVSILSSPQLAILAQDDALGIPARVMSYRASAAYSFRLRRGERKIIGAIASPLGATTPATTNSRIRLTAVALEAR